jgi:NTP pyrophosphatase (non-canonical NTP hydrolase)
VTGHTPPRDDAGLTLDGYQARAVRTDVLPDADEDAYVLPLLGLIGEIGGIASELKKRRRDEQGYRGFDDQLREELGDALWYLAVLAHRAGLPLSRLAAENLAKAEHAFGPADPVLHPGYDADRPPEQRLPRRLAVRFSETTVERHGEDVPTVVVHVLDDHGEPLGDPIDDNSGHDDDYRFHDVFHLAHMAVLGWSPVLRATLRPKRKRRGTRHDRTEDGARAIAVEEGLTAVVFAQARHHSHFTTTDRVPGDLLKLCRSLTSALEVSDRSAGDWQRALLEGYRVFALLRENRGGVVVADQDTGTLDYRNP